MVKRITLGSGDILEDEQFDGSDGEPVQIRARGKNWTIRNVTVENNGTTTPFRVVDQGGSSLVENVYVEGVQNNAFFTNGQLHSGHIDARYIHCRDIGSGEDFWYNSPPSNDDTDQWARQTGKDKGAGGTIDFYRCYGEDIEGYGVRQGGATGVVKECVMKNCKVPFATLYGGGNNGRAGKPVYFKDCAGSGYECGLRVGTHVDRNQPWNSNDVIAVADGVEISMSRGKRVELNEHGWRTHRDPVTELRGEIGSDPDLSIPPNCPRNAADVFDDDRRGEQNNATAGDDWRHVVVDLTNATENVEYGFDASASEVRKGDKADPQETVEGRVGRGEGFGGVDDFYVLSSELPHLNGAWVEGSPGDVRQARILVDGQPFAFERRATTPRAHEISVTSKGEANYWLVVTDEPVAHERGDATINDNDQAVEAGADGEWVASGRVFGGTDSYDSDGELVGVLVDGPGADSVEVRFDGERVEF